MNTLLGISWALSGFIYVLMVVTLIICLMKGVIKAQLLMCSCVSGHCISSSRLLQSPDLKTSLRVTLNLLILKL